MLEYAQKFASTPGKHDGLYWPTDRTGREPARPALRGRRRPGEGYHGYHYKILTAQGKDAPGGAYDYVIGNRMRGGFALVAWPIRYGDTGVMSFMVNHDGVVYEKDLGPGTDAAGAGDDPVQPGPQLAEGRRTVGPGAVRPAPIGLARRCAPTSEAI